MIHGSNGGQTLIFSRLLPVGADGFFIAPMYFFGG
jgi:hypothetical protein